MLILIIWIPAYTWYPKNIHVSQFQGLQNIPTKCYLIEVPVKPLEITFEYIYKIKVVHGNKKK